VRGLSTILILKRIMDGVNRNRATEEHLFHRRNLDALQPLCSRDPAPPLLGRLRPCSASAQVLTRSANGPQLGSQIRYHCTIHNLCQPELIPRQLSPSAFSLWLHILKMSVSLLPSHFPSPLLTHLSSHLLSYLSSKTFFSRSHSGYLHPRLQNATHPEHRAGKRTLERTQSRRADRGSLEAWALRGQVRD
jgi:hypothetical protein